MSRSDQLFKWRTMKVPNRSGFNKSFQNLFTMPVGTLVPLLCDEVLPNTNIKLSALISASLPPLASSTFMRCRIKAESFFIPLRQLYGGFQSWYTQEQIRDTVSGNYVVPGLPYATFVSNNSLLSRVFGPGSLADFLGYKFESSQLTSIASASPAVTYSLNIFPFLAYHWVYDHYYRNSQVTKPIFTKPFSGASASVQCIPFQAYSSATPFALSLGFPDNISLFQLRQRNFDIDYFTSGTPQAQQGSPQSVTVVSNQFSIASLRASNSLQQMLERSNAAGFRLVDFVKAHFGAYLSDGQAQRPIYLGSGSFDVYSKGIYQNSENSGSSNNPFNSVASEYGSAFAGGKIDLIDNFTSSEPGYIFVMISLVPRATYSTGVLAQNRKLRPSSTPAEMGFPALQNIGNQPIMASELNAALDFLGTDAVFAFTDRFAEYMTREDELHGLLRDGESLQSFALQRSGSSLITGGNTSISTLFLNIPQTYLDQVAATNAGISNYGCWVDSYLDYRVSMPLHQYSTPSLQDPAAEHGHTVVMERGGQKL